MGNSLPTPATALIGAVFLSLLFGISPVQAAELQRVMVGPFPDRTTAAAVLGEIEARGIEVYQMRPRDDGHWLSVGVFRQPANAAAMRERVAGLGLDLPQVVIAGRPPATTDLPIRLAAAEITEAEPSSETLEESAPLIFGTPPDAPAAPPVAAEPVGAALRHGIDRVRLEGGVFTHSDRPADGSLYLRAEPYLQRQIDDTWEIRLGVRLDGYRQTGNRRVSELDLDYAESYLRYRDARNRVTLGAQSITWGRMDELAPNDQLSVVDFTRFVLDDIADRRRMVPLLRWEHFRDSGNHDLVWIPRFRAAEQADDDSVWSLIDRERGRLPGLPFDPLVAPLIREGRFTADEPRSGAGGWRFSRWQRGLDYAVNIINTPHSLPYFALSDPARETLLATGDPQAVLDSIGDQPVFIARHPRTWVVGGDIGFEARGVTWRFELAWLSDVPVTRRDTLRMETVEALRWGAGAEFFPGDADLRVSLQVTGQSLIDTGPVLDRTSTVTLGGEIEDTFAVNRWRGRMRFAVGLDQKDVYLNPEISYIGFEPHEVYLGYHHFSGAERGVGGFYDRNNVVMLGIRTRF